MLWQLTDIGDGYATPVVVGTTIYLLGNRGLENEFVQALSAKDGKPIWSTRLGKVGNPNMQPSYPKARSTPTVDGGSSTPLGSDGDLACLETTTGKVLWRKNLRNDFGGQPGTWAYAESPLIDGEVLVATPGGKAATMVALNKNNGAVIWKSAVPGGDPARLFFGHCDGGRRAQAVRAVPGPGVVGVDAKTGEFLWRYDQTSKGPANIATPVVLGDYVYNTNSRRFGAALVQLHATGNSVTAEQVYFGRDLPNTLGGQVLVDKFIYGTNSQGPVCAEFATGKVRWQAPGVGPGSVLYADGRLYFHGENGDVALVEATPDAYLERGRFALPAQPKRGIAGGSRDEHAWAYPVVANGRLYIRDLGSLWCYDIRTSKAAARAAAHPAAGDWNSFRGPNASGVAETAGLPVEFGPSTNVAWKAGLPAGRLVARADQGSDLFDGLRAGESVDDLPGPAHGAGAWRKEMAAMRSESRHKLNSPASSTPVTDGENVFAFFPDFGLVSYSGDGRERWRLPLGPFTSLHGMAASPVLYGDKLLLVCDQDNNSYVAALQKETGATVWKTERPEVVHGFATPTIFHAPGGKTQLIVPGSYQVVAYALDTGEKLWWARGLSWQIKTTAVVDRDTIFVTGWAPGADAGERLEMPPFAEVVKEADTNGDGKLSAAEVPPKWKHSGSWDFIDLNRDGALDAREWELSQGPPVCAQCDHGDPSGRCARGPNELARAVVLRMFGAAGVVSAALPTRSVHGERRRYSDGARRGKGQYPEAGPGARGSDAYYASPVAADNKIFLLSENGKASVSIGRARMGRLRRQRPGRAVLRDSGPGGWTNLPAHANHAVLFRQTRRTARGSEGLALFYAVEVGIAAQEHGAEEMAGDAKNRPSSELRANSRNSLPGAITAVSPPSPRK